MDFPRANTYLNIKKIAMNTFFNVFKFATLSAIQLPIFITLCEKLYAQSPNNETLLLILRAKIKMDNMF